MSQSLPWFFEVTDAWMSFPPCWLVTSVWHKPNGNYSTIGLFAHEVYRAHVYVLFIRLAIRHTKSMNQTNYSVKLTNKQPTAPTN